MSAESSALDEAWSAHVAGRSEEAIRTCTEILEVDAAQIGAASLLAPLLLAEGRAVEKSIAQLATRNANRGDLPRAVALAGRIDDEKTLRSIAQAYGKGSPRQADVPPAPPPLPVQLEKKKGPPAKVSKKELLDAGAAALRAHLATPPPKPGKVPRLPLFGDLEAAQLVLLLGAFERRTLAAGETAIEEGEDGREAFVVVRGHLRAERGEGEARHTLAELGPGALFGEMALVSSAPRAASVTAVDAVELLVARRDVLEKLAKKTKEIDTQLSEFCRTRMLTNLMRHSAILNAVPKAERAALLARFEARRFRAGEALLVLDQEPAGLYLVASGKVQVLGRDADGDALQIAELGPGDVVGEISLVLRRPAGADVVALHPTVALELTREEFQDAIRAHPTLLSELYDLATKRDEETRSVVAQETLDIEDMVLL